MGEEMEVTKAQEARMGSVSVSHRQQPARGPTHSTQTVAHGASNGMMRGSREWWQRLRVPKGVCLVTGRWPLWTRS